MVTPEQSEQCVAHVLQTFPKATHARVCRLSGCSRKKKYYSPKMPAKDAVVKKAIQEVVGTSRKGRVKVIRLVQKKHPEMGSFKIRRVYEREGFALNKRLRRRMKDHPKNPLPLCLAANEEWAMDFMSDALANGKKIRTLNVVDHYNRFCLGIKVGQSLPARAVTRCLDELIESHGAPQRIRTDNGPEFRSKHFQKWLNNRKIAWSPIQKGKPQQNAIVERFNRTFREDVLNANLFISIEHAEQIIQQWKVDYNQIRPHQSLNFQTPASYAA